MPTLTECYPLVMCADCALIIANGAESDEDKAHARVMFEHTADWHGHIVSGEQTDDFSAARCDTCGTDLAGHRFAGHLLVSGNRM